MLDRWLQEPAPAERLAMFRVLLGTLVVGYIAVRHRAFLDLLDQPDARFEPVGVLSPTSAPLPDWLVPALLAVAIVAGVAFTIGAGFRVAGPVLAASLLALTTYRSSWGQLLHFENLMVIHVVIVGLSPAAAAFSLDARRLQRTGPASPPPASSRFGWPLRLAALATVITYVIAGLAKLRYGGTDWMLGDTLRNHVAYSASRLELLGESPSPLAEWLVPHAWLFPPLAVGSVIIELTAPVALFGRRLRNVWVVLAWTMHLAILGMMSVAFHYPLLGVAYAPFFRLERLLPGYGRSGSPASRSVASRSVAADAKTRVR